MPRPTASTPCPTRSPTPPTPPQGRRENKKPGGKKRGARKAKKTRTPRAARPAEVFIPAVDADTRLVIVNGGPLLHFTEEQTVAIATLLANHYEG